MSLEERIKNGYDSSLINVDGSARERTYYTFEPSMAQRRETAQRYFLAAVAATNQTAASRPWDTERFSVGLAACNVAAQMMEALKP